MDPRKGIQAALEQLKPDCRAYIETRTLKVRRHQFDRTYVEIGCRVCRGCVGAFETNLDEPSFARDVAATFDNCLAAAVEQPPAPDAAEVPPTPVEAEGVFAE